MSPCDPSHGLHAAPYTTNGIKTDTAKEGPLIQESRKWQTGRNSLVPLIVASRDLNWAPRVLVPSPDSSKCTAPKRVIQKDVPKQLGSRFPWFP